MEAHLQLSRSSNEDLLSNTIDDDPNGFYQSERISSQTQDINPNESQMKDINLNESQTYCWRKITMKQKKSF